MGHKVFEQSSISDQDNEILAVSATELPIQTQVIERAAKSNPTSCKTNYLAAVAQSISVMDC